MAGQVIPSAFQREYLLGLQRQLLHYFLDNQAASGAGCHPPGQCEALPCRTS